MWIDNLSNEEYHARGELNSSFLREVLRSPKHAEQSRKEKKEQTDAMRMGTHIHSAILEGKDFKPFVIDPAVVCPDAKSPRSTKAFKELAELHPNYIMPDELETCYAIAEAVWSHPIAGDLLSRATHKEQSGFFELAGSMCKIRPDGRGPGFVFDLKTTDDVRFFERKIRDHDLALQLEMQRIGCEIIEGVPHENYWIVVERDAPYSVRVCRPDEGCRARGTRDLLSSIDEWSKYLSGFYSGGKYDSIEDIKPY